MLQSMKGLSLCQPSNKLAHTWNESEHTAASQVIDVAEIKVGEEQEIKLIVAVQPD